MEGETSPELREECFKKGAHYTFTEMARVAALVRDNKSTLEKIRITNGVPTHIQVIGGDEKQLDTWLTKFKPPKGFLGINLNMGCPSPSAIKSGLGCASIKRISKIKRLIQIIKDHGYTASIKLRLGMNQYEKDKKIYLNLIKEVDADFFIVHGRHGKEKYAKNDFSVYKECVATGKKIIANGDITTKKQIEFLKSIGIKGAMIGREAIKDPSVFERLRSEE